MAGRSGSGGRHKARYGGEMSFGERMAALRASRARSGRDPSPKKKSAKKGAKKTTALVRVSPARKAAPKTCTLEQCKKLVQRAEAALAKAQKHKAEAAWEAGSRERRERALERMAGPFGAPFGMREPRTIPTPRMPGRFEGTFEERMRAYGGPRFEGPVSPAHDPGRKRGHKRGRKHGARDASLMDMRDHARGRGSQGRSRGRDSAYDWPGESCRHSEAAHLGWKRRRRTGRDPEPRLSGRDSAYDWPGESCRHGEAARLGWKRRRRSGRDAALDWPGQPRRHAKAAKKGWKRRHRTDREIHQLAKYLTRSQVALLKRPRAAGRGRDASYDWPGDSPGHAKASKKGWRRRRLCAAHRAGHGRDASYDWPGDAAGHRKAAKKGWRHRYACSPRRDW